MPHFGSVSLEIGKKLCMMKSPTSPLIRRIYPKEEKVIRHESEISNS